MIVIAALPFRFGLAIASKVADSSPDSLASDELRLKAVRTTLDRLGVAGKIRIDVNGLWNLDQAMLAIPILEQAAGGLDYIEQPCTKISIPDPT